MRLWREFALLGSIGHVGYRQSHDIVEAFANERPDENESRLWEDLLVTGGVVPRIPRSQFYLPSGLRNDADRILARVLRDRTTLAVNEVDPEENGVAPLPWFAANVYKASSALIHLRGPQRVREKIHNARASILGGLAAGLELPTLMIAEEGFVAPFDYRDLMQTYSTTKHLTERVNSWLDELPAMTTGKSVGRRVLNAELPVRGFGEYVAEYEEGDLAEYFVPTGEFQAVIASSLAVFVGRKGTGKTANMLRAAELLRADKRNVVTSIKPSGYELLSILEVLSKLPRQEASNFLLEAIWQYLLLTEIAISVVADAEERPAGISVSSPAGKLRTYLQTTEGMAVDFATRLEGLLKEVSDRAEQMPAGVAASQNWVTRQIYKDHVGELKQLISESVADRERIAVLIDNLDKAWDRDADQEKQSQLILGLLGAVGKVEKELRRAGAGRNPTRVTLAVFLRADIFDVVRKFAREPDKITTLQIRWTDPELRARIIEDRYVFQRDGKADPDDLWQDLFAATVKGVETRRYILERSLPRPRDLVFLCNAAAVTASNRRHSRIEEEDIITAESDYSSFAFDALLVEGVQTEELDNVLFEFAGGEATLDWVAAEEIVASASTGTSCDELMTILIRSNFLGVEVNDGVFEYVADDHSERRAKVMNRKLISRLGRPGRVTIHPAFRPYLSIAENSSSGMNG